MERKDTKREVWIDWMRVAACFFVMVTHCCEPFYYGGEGTLLLTQSDAVWLSIINTLVRASVALFVVASSYLLFPPALYLNRICPQKGCPSPHPVPFLDRCLCLGMERADKGFRGFAT